LILDKEKVTSLKGQSLKDQLKVFKLAEAPNLKGITANSKVNDIRAGLSKAIDLYKSGEWKIHNDGVLDESESGELTCQKMMMEMNLGKMKHKAPVLIGVFNGNYNMMTYPGIDNRNYCIICTVYILQVTVCK
jgi:hypothetical protein